jgi:hypothetical protein
VLLRVMSFRMTSSNKFHVGSPTLTILEAWRPLASCHGRLCVTSPAGDPCGSCQSPRQPKFNFAHRSPEIYFGLQRTPPSPCWKLPLAPGCPPSHGPSPEIRQTRSSLRASHIVCVWSDVSSLSYPYLHTTLAQII